MSKEEFEKHTSAEKRKVLEAVSFSVLIAICLGVSGELLSQIISDGIILWRGCFFIAFVLFSFAFIILFAEIRKRYFNVNAVMSKMAGFRQKKYLIMGLSSEFFGNAQTVQSVKDEYIKNQADKNSEKINDINNEQKLSKAVKKLFQLKEAGLEKAAQNVKGMLADEKKLLFLDKDRRLDGPGCLKWVQNIRGIYAHIKDNGPLEEVVIVPSKESFLEAELFKIFMTDLLNEYNKRKDKKEVNVRITVLDEESCPDYDDFNAVKTALDIACKKVSIHKKNLKNHICVDATSGKATFSIGAALMTLSQDLIYSYTTTMEPNTDKGGDVLFYDAQIDMAAFVDGGI